MPRPALAAPAALAGGAGAPPVPPVLSELRLESFAPVPTVDLGRTGGGAGAGAAPAPLRGLLRAVNPGAEPAVLAFDRLGGDAADGWQVRLLPLAGAGAGEDGDGAAQQTLAGGGGACLIEVVWSPPAAKAAAGGASRACIWFRANGRQRLNVVAIARCAPPATAAAQVVRARAAPRAQRAQTLRRCRALHAHAAAPPSVFFFTRSRSRCRRKRRRARAAPARRPLARRRPRSGLRGDDPPPCRPPSKYLRRRGQRRQRPWRRQLLWHRPWR